MNRYFHSLFLLKILFLLFLFLFQPSPTYAEPYENAIVICVDGVSRSTFYPLLKQGRLSSMKILVKSGNFRNMGTGFQTNIYSERVKDLLSFTPNSLTALREAVPSLNMALKWSVWDEAEESLSFSDAVTTGFDSVGVVSVRTRQDISDNLVQYVSTVDSPFVLVANFPQVDEVGQRLREGSERYSIALERVDRALYPLRKAVHSKGLSSKTLWVFVTTHGFNRRSQISNSEVWIASSKKVRVKGTLSQVLPSVFAELSNTPEHNKLF